VASGSGDAIDERISRTRFTPDNALEFIEQLEAGHSLTLRSENLLSYSAAVREWVSEVAAEEILVTPLYGKDGLIGAITVDNRRGGRRFLSDDVALIEGLSNQASIAVENARLVEDLRRSREQVRRADRLGSLGMLAAGLAHEINNPASAATRAVDALESACQALLSSVDRLARDDISPSQFAALESLRREIDLQAADQDPLSRADREQALSSWLTRHGVTREWTIAPTLAAAGVDPEWCERAATVLDGSSLEPGLEWVASTFSVATLLAEVKESTRRISELVAAVRSYSQMDRASMQRIDVTHGLESTLVMLGHKLRDGITVVREYSADVPMLEAYAGELNQVWTNLIDNAVDAMNGAGTLRVATRLEGDHVAVEIGDTGPGMSPQVAARAFEAFYTTKDVGNGTGLGLDIARRIVVERHGGRITIDSQPGETVLRVHLPVRPH
jgi:signal transduction histidine kinase